MSVPGARAVGPSRIVSGPGGRVSFTMEYHLPAPPERLWPILADTERLNRRIGLPPTQREPSGSEPVAAARIRARLHGIPLEWEEEPFLFVEGQRYWVRRRMRGGPLREFNGGVRFEADPHGTRVRVESELQPANPLGALLVQALCRKTRADFEQLVAEVLAHLRDEGAPAFGAGVDIAPPPERDAVLARLQAADPALRAHPLASRLFEYVASQGDVALHAMRPFNLALQWGEDRYAVLQLCLRAARAGVLDMSWDLLCPNCRGTAESWSRLEQVRETAHCASCRITYGAHFDRSVEVTFRPNRAYRAVDTGLYCGGGPMNTPHVVLQWVLAAGEEVELAPRLSPGRYQLRNLTAELAADVYVEEEGVGALTAVFEVGVKLSRLPLRAGVIDLGISNRTGTRQQVILERMASFEDAATAAVVTVQQDFRDLFGSEVLSPGVRLGIETLPLMFTDLRGSTALYRELGDASAYALVRDHFELLQGLIARHGGGVVKTIGDAVMAAFPTAADAMGCALEIQRALARFNEGRPAPVRLKVGLHQGPCIAVRSYDDRLDYFGSTVNLAARTHGMSTGEDVTVTASLLSDRAAAALVEGLPQERFTAELRGIGDVELVRIREDLKRET